jgi:hypothetical protein
MTQTNEDPRPVLMPTWLCLLCAILGVTGYATETRWLAAIAVGLGVAWFTQRVRLARWLQRHPDAA